MEVLLVLATIFSMLTLAVLVTLLLIALWFLRQIQLLGNPKLIISKGKKTIP